MEAVYEAIGVPAASHCDACFTGNYPLGDGGEGNGKFALEDLTTAATSSAAREPQATGHPAKSDAGAAGSGAPVASH
jgi:hypothetical protein